MSSKKIFKFGFIAYLQTVTLALKFPCVVSVIWKRGQKAAEVKQRKQIQKGVITFNQRLQIECNMIYDTQKELFQEKKTKFTILIFSQKGNKQAGQVYLDVAELLNQKKKQMLYEKLLQKCPDKNAKLKVQLSGYMKNQITSDDVSKASIKTYNMQTSLNQIKPDFKKKKQQISSIQQKKQQKIISSIKQQKIQKNIPITIAKQNISKVQLIKIQQQNKKLKQQLKQLKQLEIENDNLKRQYQDNQKKQLSYYKKKFQEMKKQYNEAKHIIDSQKMLNRKKNQLEKQMCECKERMGRILNFAIMSNNNELAQQFYNIYQLRQQKV